MGRTTDDQGRPLILRSPRQASKNFGLDRYTFNGSVNGTIVSAPRPKFMFLVRFLRAAGVGGQAWKEGLSVAVKRFERPTISPVTQELNQYNKKRIIHTGVKYGPVNIEFHDTADSVVSSMWQEYASYHFGDQRHTTQENWTYDVVSRDGGFQNTSGGFGFTLPPKAQDINSPYFFSKVECYQFFGGQYTQFDIVNPKISSFNPDDMDYDNDGSHGIRMTMEYETVITHNQGVPQFIRNSPVANLLGMSGGDGDVYEPPGSAFPQYSNVPSNQYGDGSTLYDFSPAGMNSLLNNGQSQSYSSTGRGSLLGNIIGPGVLGGALGGQGPMDFGGGVQGSALLNQLIGGDMAGAGKSLKNGILGPGLVNLIEHPKSAISGNVFDLARGAAQAASINGSAQPGMVGAYAQAKLTGGNLLGAINSARPPTAQVGYRVVSQPGLARDNPSDYL